MVDSNLIKFYIMFLIIFSFFAGGFTLMEESEMIYAENLDFIGSIQGNLDSEGTSIDNSCSVLQEPYLSGVSTIASPMFKLYCLVFHSTDTSDSTLFAIMKMPFQLFGVLILLIVLLGVGFSVLNPFVQMLLILPVCIFIIIDYILPYIRGN